MHLGVDVSIYLSNIIANNGGKGTRVRGQSSGIVATIKNFILPPEEGVDDITIFVKYNQSGTNGESTAFPLGWNTSQVFSRFWYCNVGTQFFE